MGAGRVSATSTVAAVLGSPVRHSRSPLIMNSAFREVGLDWIFVAFEVERSVAEPAIAGVRALKLGGVSVTMPLKDAVCDLVDRLEPEAELLRSVNCISWEDGQLIGANTDGAGFIASLKASEVDVSGARVVVVGAGGAARSVILAASSAGADSVVVVNRTRSSAEAAASLAGARGMVGDPSAVADADIVVNATSIGMDGTDSAGEEVLPPGLLRPGQVVVDLVYNPLVTPLLQRAGAAGATAIDGLGMLVHQAALAFERWTGSAPPLDAMDRAARVQPG